MADLQEIILSRYGIDIAKENIFKLYKIDKPDIAPQELDIKIQDTRKRWNQSINGANEKNAIRDKERMDKADQYEAILKDDRLRKELFAYYNGTGAKGGMRAAPAEPLILQGSILNCWKRLKKFDRMMLSFSLSIIRQSVKIKKPFLKCLKKSSRSRNWEKTKSMRMKRQKRKSKVRQKMNPVR